MPLVYKNLRDTTEFQRIDTGIGHGTSINSLKSQSFLNGPRFKYTFGSFHLLVLYTLYILLIPQCFALSYRRECKSVGYISTGICYGAINTRSFCVSQRRHGLGINSSKVDQILEELKVLTLMETAELVKKIEETFGVSATPVMQVQAAGVATVSGQTEETKEEEEEEEEKKKKTSFEVLLTEVKTEKRMSMFRTLKSLMPDHDLQQIKKIMDNLPFSLNIFKTQKEADELKAKIEESGGTVKIQ
ncbi:conserved hypothetical protein [Theileria equi strain WA]|uniref:50S ribosomal protein L12 n=1 Tax=Theileria equi strain WA TaxID=1537102 RepID=L1LBV3_THEEQ|nr:conserved hypothetical protein [Theileria equi strain WA]EKX72922.1 conserved hypothetical protein [Theileria equi strain WA]|eukprot:XP_004832374.1 conserved hypothetical protein [Theileria equi strain WA]